MDPLTASTTFATLVGLICNYRQEKGAAASLDHQKFIEWLDYHRHEELKNLISNTASLQTEVDAILRSDHVQMLEKLDQMNGILASLVGRLDEFKGLVHVVVPNSELSDQAVSILQQFVSSDAEYFFYLDYGSQEGVLGVPNGAGFEITEPKFVGDDLTKLVALGLLRLEHNGNGDPLFYITRNAGRFLKAIGYKQDSHSPEIL